MYDIKKTRERYIEAELAHYHKTKKEIEEIERDIIYAQDRRIRDPVDRDRGDVTADKALALIEHRKLARLRRIVMAIESAYADMTDEQKQLVRMRYWSRPPMAWREIARKLYYSERKVFSLRAEVLKMIDERL